MSHRGLPVTQQRRDERRKQAEARQAEYDQLSNQQKLDRLPVGGANRQRARLEALLNKAVSVRDSVNDMDQQQNNNQQKKTKKEGK